MCGGEYHREFYGERSCLMRIRYGRLNEGRPYFSGGVRRVTWGQASLARTRAPLSISGER